MAGGIKGRKKLNLNTAKATHKHVCGIAQRRTPWMNIRSIDIACTEFFKSRNMPIIDPAWESITKPL